MQVHAAVSIVDTTACFLIASLVADDFNACCFGHGLPVVELFLAWRGKAGVGQGEAELFVFGLAVAVIGQKFQLGAKVVLHEKVMRTTSGSPSLLARRMFSRIKALSTPVKR